MAEKLLPGGKFTRGDIFTIRDHWDHKTMSTKEMAEMWNCVPETIRKIGRRDIFRDVIGPEGLGVSEDHRSTVKGQTPQAAQDRALVEGSVAKLQEMLAKEGLEITRVGAGTDTGA